MCPTIGVHFLHPPSKERNFSLIVIFALLFQLILHSNCDIDATGQHRNYLSYCKINVALLCFIPI